jgi:hypothetical protein
MASGEMRASPHQKPTSLHSIVQTNSDGRLFGMTYLNPSGRDPFRPMEGTTALKRAWQQSRENAPFPPQLFLLCLSRACVGKTIIVLSIAKWPPKMGVVSAPGGSDRVCPCTCRTRLRSTSCGKAVLF